jgi:hypothetical protein
MTPDDVDLDFEHHLCTFEMGDGRRVERPMPWWLRWVNPMRVARRVPEPPRTTGFATPDDPFHRGAIRFPDLDDRLLCPAGDDLYPLPVDLDRVASDDHELWTHALFIAAVVEDRWYGRHGHAHRIPSLLRCFSPGASLGRIPHDRGPVLPLQPD